MNGTSLSTLGLPQVTADWHVHAACAGKDPEMWFPEAGRGETRDYTRARAICDRCPVIEECRHIGGDRMNLSYKDWIDFIFAFVYGLLALAAICAAGEWRAARIRAARRAYWQGKRP